jgi:hypothetical protein
MCGSDIVLAKGGSAVVLAKWGSDVADSVGVVKCVCTRIEVVGVPGTRCVYQAIYPPTCWSKVFSFYLSTLLDRKWCFRSINPLVKTY